MPDAAPAARGVYTPRRPQASPLFRLVSDHLHRLQTVFDDRFAREYGPWRPVVAQVAETFLACGVRDHGFARIRGEDCAHDYLLAFSCKCRDFSPSCHAKRLAIWTQWLDTTLLAPVPHRQVVLTIPKRLRTQVSSTFIAPGADSALDRTNGLVFVSEPLAAATTLSGAFTGSLALQLNVRDVDLAVELYERTADGAYAQLSYHLGRASLARDPRRRTLLVPDATEHIPVTGARVSSRVLGAGSQLVAVVRVNKNPQSQVNYGSGKDPSDETAADAPRLLQMRVLGGSRLRVPVLR